MSTADTTTAADTPEKQDRDQLRAELKVMEEKFRKCFADISKDRTYRLKTYKNCFVGREAVDAIVATGVVQSRQDAVTLGQALMTSRGGMFEHVLRDHDFEDKYLFYRLLGENERGARQVDNLTGANVGWDSFLASSRKSSDTKETETEELGEEKAEVASFLPHMPVPDFEAIAERDVHAAKHVWPMDEYNTKLLDNVHPPNWIDAPPKSKPAGKESNYQFDMVVIGGGAAGLITAAGSAGVGARVALIEANLLGGDCLNVGCVPSKALIHSANLAHTMRGQQKKNEDAGIFLDPSAVKVDFGKVMERLRRLRSEISHHDSAERYSRELGVDIFIGYGKFTSERTIEVNGKTLTFKRAAIATGGYPVLIPMKGLADLYEKGTAIDTIGQSRPIIATNETIFNLTRAPRHLVVIGAGVIGMELSQAMQRLGVKTTVLGRSGRVLPKEDQDLANIVKEQMVDDGVEFRLSVKEYVEIRETGKILENGHPELALTIKESSNEDTVSTAEILCDAVLVAAGRRPNVTGMDLEKAKVQYDTIKGLVVNDKLQTTNSRVYGVGDCCSEYKFTHAADFMARAVIRNALFLGKEKMSELLIPYATFTSPEIASVGLYEKDLKEKGVEYRIIEKHFKDVDRAKLDDTEEGMVRFRVSAKTDKILGATIVGEGAGNMISEVTLAIQSDTGLGSLASVIHPYPTTAEAVRQAGDLYNRTRLTTTVKSLLRGVISIQR